MSAAAPTPVPRRSRAAAAAPRALGPERGGPLAFATSVRLTPGELVGAPVRTPRPSRLDAPLEVKSAKLRAGLAAAGVTCVGELLEHLPREHRALRALEALAPGDQATVSVEVRSIRTRTLRRRGQRPLVEATVFDDSGTLRAAFFNQPWLARRYAPGTRLLLHGKLDDSGTMRVWSHAPDGDQSSAWAAGDGVAHYPASEGVSSTQIASLVRASRGSLHDFVEALPASARSAPSLPDKAGALGALHFFEDAAARELGRRRLAYEELLLGQLVLLRRRALRRASLGAATLSGERSRSERWLSQGLPFSLTADQRGAVRTIDADLASDCAMQRLLIGEVGSGKTVVATYAMLRAVENGHQAVLMAPTETLAEQHFGTLAELLREDAVPLALLSSSTPARVRRALLRELAAGGPSITVGTHALIEPDVVFRSLAVAVVDEQHRFGVRQRALLEQKGGIDAEAPRAPHVLHMTATPIPRTLALATYGDLDVSILRTLPRGRGALRTRVVTGAGARARAYEALRAELTAGRQAYVVCPLVSEPEDGAADAVAAGSEPRAAEEELRRLARGELKGFRLALLHGQMRPAEKQAAMAAFARGQAQVLVSTTVIEVGIDVSNATVMVVENAERFGISQLHQLRGRVGRGKHPSACILMTAPAAVHSRRLRALAEHADGFKLAEIDLELRGRGEIVGIRQSGSVAYRFARLPEDAALLLRARACAEQIMACDAELCAPEHALLRHELGRAFGAEALAPIRP